MRAIDDSLREKKNTKSVPLNGGDDFHFNTSLFKAIY